MPVAITVIPMLLISNRFSLPYPLVSIFSFENSLQEEILIRSRELFETFIWSDVDSEHRPIINKL